MTCPNCGQWVTTTAHVCPTPLVATGGYVPTDLDRLRARVAELEQALSILSTLVPAGETCGPMTLAVRIGEHVGASLARLAAAEQDAKRYRFVRRKMAMLERQYDGAEWWKFCSILHQGKTLDDSLDALMDETTQPDAAIREERRHGHTAWYTSHRGRRKAARRWRYGLNRQFWPRRTK